jgi:EmrB/QacA subfamily drug resistance transporter
MVNLSVSSQAAIPLKRRYLIIAATLLALFLGALDALIMAAAVPSIVADLGGLDLFSWVYSAYLLSRTVTLPIFGKLADVYETKTLYIISILIFIAASLAAGFADSMLMLIACRTIQGIGAGGNFALVYVVLADISPAGERGKTLSLASFIWGLASVLGPTLGGVIVAYFAWPWIFFINVPLGVLSLIGVSLYLTETRVKKKEASIDFGGAVTLTIAILALLFIFLLAGQTYAWHSPRIMALWAAAIVFGTWFIRIEGRAKHPILPIGFFKRRGFSVGNTAVFMSSFAIFAFFGFAPLFIQGALGKSPIEVGQAILALSLGWSIGSLVLGRLVHRWGNKRSAVFGAVFLIAGCTLTLTFSPASSMTTCFWVFALIGVGMGFVALATILVVQDSVDASNLGVATAAHQFSRNLGGTVGIGLCGSIFTAGFSSALKTVAIEPLPEHLAGRLQQKADSLLQPEIQAQLSPEMLLQLQQAVAHGALLVFWTTLGVAVLCLVCCLYLPSENPNRSLKDRL